MPFDYNDAKGDDAMEIDKDAYDFGMRLKKLREINKLSQAQLAARVGVRPETITRYENNTKVPSLYRAAKLVKTLNGSLDYLMGVDDEPSIRIYDLPPEKQEVLLAFLKAFVIQK